MAQNSETFEVAIVGGGVIGSAVAYFLTAHPDFDGRIAVIERDPTYVDCATARSVGGIRQQFSTPENILLSRFAADFVKRADEHLSVDQTPVNIGFVEAGYLFLASGAKLEALEANHETQIRHGAEVALLDTEALASRFPWLETSDISAGSLGLANEGWIDPHALLMAFRAKARSAGARYIHGEVTAVTVDGGRVRAVRLRGGESISCGILVNAAGARAAQVAQLAAVPLPVKPRKRQVFVFDCKTGLSACPLVIDPSGLYFRPEGTRYVCGISPPSSEDPDTFDHVVDYGVFESRLWPLLAARVRAFEAIRLHSAWACTYAYNTLDQNAIIGAHPEVENFIFANGFSGHGLQQSPGVGRALSELIVEGRYRSIDLARLGFARIADSAPVLEVNVV